MADSETAVETFLDRANSVFEDYENGYTDPDAALAMLESHVNDLRDEVES
jgi:hypothetical protein